MKKSDIVRRLVGETGLTRSAAEAAVNSMLSCVADSLPRDDVSLVGFGTLASRHRPARTARNPRTGETIPGAPSTTAVVQTRQGPQGCHERPGLVVNQDSHNTKDK